MAESLTEMGAPVDEETAQLTVHGDEIGLTGATLDGRDDHRIIMALAIAGLVAEGTTTIRGTEHVDVSFPTFFDVLDELGATTENVE
jgi:3-phosphoshikimate 1-carboxyvinyltransferase